MFIIKCPYCEMEMIEHLFLKTGKCSECGKKVNTEEKGSKYKKAKINNVELNDIELSFSNRKKESKEEKPSSQSKLLVSKTSTKKVSTPVPTSALLSKKEKEIQNEKQKITSENFVAKKNKNKTVENAKKTEPIKQEFVEDIPEIVNEGISDETNNTSEHLLPGEYEDELIGLGLGCLNYDSNVPEDDEQDTELQSENILTHEKKTETSRMDLERIEFDNYVEENVIEKNVSTGVQEALGRNINGENVSDISKNEYNTVDEEDDEAHDGPSLKDVILSKYKQVVLHDENETLKCSDWLKEKRRQNLEKKQEQMETSHEFNFNHDGFYSDTASIGEAKPDTIGKQILIKAVGSVVALFLIIAFLIYYA